jgi:DNA-binding NtrC family response regulator
MRPRPYSVPEDLEKIDSAGPGVRINDMTKLAPLVLLVENDAPQREVLDFIMRRFGLNTLHAGNLTEARRHLNAAPDLVILDFYLEPEAGTDLLEDIADGVPVLLLTASIEAKIMMDKYRRLNAVLQKPAMPEQLRATVAYLLGLPVPD